VGALLCRRECVVGADSAVESSSSSVDPPDGVDDSVLADVLPPLDDTVVLGDSRRGELPDDAEPPPVASSSAFADDVLLDGPADPAPPVSDVELPADEDEPPDELDPPSSACATPDPVASAAPTPRVIAPAPNHA
jgi:hypothetical protein